VDRSLSFTLISRLAHEARRPDRFNVPLAGHSRCASLNDPDHSPGLVAKNAEEFMDYDDTKERLPVVFGRNLRAARLGAGLTPSEVAQRTGIAPGLLIQIESGTVDPDLILVGKLAKVVGCAAFMLLRGIAPQ
jgi:DNA-binding XRE family transcriptional regulator